jgi:acyl-CoA synthetase (AMP-forming)/AMP-acid ligase II
MKAKTKNLGGRPKKIINKKLFEELCGYRLIRNEICTSLGVSDKVLTNWCKETYNLSFSAIYKIKALEGNISLRRAGRKMAETVPSVWIFHAKNELGMTDKQEVKNTGTIVVVKDDVPKRG